MCCDMDPYDWLNKFISFYIAAVVGVISGYGLSIDTCCGNPPNGSKLALYKLLICFNSHLKHTYVSKKTEYSGYKGGCGVLAHTCIKVYKR